MIFLGSAIIGAGFFPIHIQILESLDIWLSPAGGGEGGGRVVWKLIKIIYAATINVYNLLPISFAKR